MMLFELGKNINKERSSFEGNRCSVSLALFSIVIQQKGDQLPMIRLLLQHGAEMNQQTNKVLAPLHAAALYSKPAIVQLLLEHDVEVDLVCRHDDPKYASRTALEFSWGNALASLTTRVAVATKLLEAGASVSRRSSDSSEPILRQAMCMSDAIAHGKAKKKKWEQQEEEQPTVVPERVVVLAAN